MIIRIFQLVVFVCLMAGCTDEKISIPVPVTHTPVRKSERQVTLSMSVVKNRNKDMKTGFLISQYPTSSPDNIPFSGVSTDSYSNGIFYSTLQENRLFSGVEYYIRSYVELNKKWIYGNEVSFTTASGFNQSIDSIVPDSGKQNDTFEIQGLNFVPGFTVVGLRHNNTDKFFQTELISISENSIIVKVPNTEGIYGLMDLNIYVNHYNGEQFTGQSSFTVDPD